MNSKTVIVGVLLLLLSAGILFGSYHISYDTKETYHVYEVKTEQIETDAGYQGNATNIDDLSEDEQRAIFEAYKKSDHFLGGSSSEVHLTEPLALDDDSRWQAIEIEGARLLVGIYKTNTYTRAVGGYPVLAVLGTIIGLCITVYGAIVTFAGFNNQELK